jgi:GNAT superfamily N-acetyltransferase
VAGSPIEITHAAPDRLSALAPVFGRAFVDEPMMRWPMGTHGDVVDRFTRCFAHVLADALRLGFVLEAGAAKGSAIWFPPDGFETQADDPWNRPEISALTDDGGRRREQFWDWVHSHTPDEPLWELDSIAVEPAAQGQGFGTALIGFGLARARSDGVGAFLATGTRGNVDIYGRSGFRVVEDADAPSGGPHIWFMRWDP